MINEKRASILLILIVLLSQTDENHKLTQKEIADIIKQRWGLELERKSISNSIDIINECFNGELEFTKTPKGIYCSVGIFDLYQLEYLSDTIFNNKSLSVKEAEDVLRRFQMLTFDPSGSLKARFNQARDFGRVKNYNSFYNYGIISDALKEKTQITFNYLNHYDDNGKEVLTLDNKTGEPKRFNLSPYYLVMGNNGRHYVIGAKFYDEPNKLVSYRIEYIRNIEQKRKYQRKKKNEAIENFDNFQLAKYLEEHPKMFLNDHPTDCELLIKKEKGTLYAFDEFGMNIKLRRKDDGIHAYFKSTATALKMFAIDYSTYVEVLQPAEIREEILKTVSEITNIYKKR